MQRVNLPSGAWADLRHAQDVTERHRRPLRRIQAELSKYTEFFEVLEKAQAKIEAGKKLTKAEMDVMSSELGPALDVVDELNDRVVVALVAGWSYGPTIDIDALLDIPGSDLDALREAVVPRAAGLLPNFGPDKDRDSPTGV